MIGYWIYLIDDEVAEHYCKQAEKIIDLFREYQSAKAPLRGVLNKQIDYITKPMPSFAIQRAVFQQFPGEVEFRAEKGLYILKENSHCEEASLIVQKRRLLLWTEGNEVLASRVFAALSTLSAHFLAVDLRLQNYRWVTGKAKERKFA